jgi:uncharacterized oxidoreductase
MPTFQAEYLQELAATFFARSGAPQAEARIVAEALVRADMMGMPSHGVLRVIQYVKDIQQGSIDPSAELLIEELSPTVSLVDAQWNFGQVAAMRAVDLALARARDHGMGSALVRRCRHVGRLGAYTEAAARMGFAALATCSTAGEGHWVAPFGGREGRLGTNPISFAAPTGGDPVLLDYSTASLPEGRVRLFHDTGRELPDGALVDADGRPSNKPADLYAQDGSPAGAITPFGGEQGYKSYGLGLMAAILSSLLGVPAWREEGIESHANTMWLLVIDVGQLMDLERFVGEIGELLDYVRSAAPLEGHDGVLVPGQREYTALKRSEKEGVEVDEGVWRQIVALAEELGVELQ